MSLWTMPAELSCWFTLLAGCLDVRSQARFVALLGGVVFARGRRTVTSWLRAAGITEEFRPAYSLLEEKGTGTNGIVLAVNPCVLSPCANPSWPKNGPLPK